MKEVWLKKNKYIRLRITRVGYSFRADISINKYAYDEKEERYYEINYDVFNLYDYSSEEEALKKAKEWLYEELNKEIKSWGKVSKEEQ